MLAGAIFAFYFVDASVAQFSHPLSSLLTLMEASALMATAMAHHAIPWPGGSSTPLPCATAMACPTTVGRHIRGCPLSAWPQWPGDHISGLHRSEKLEMVLGRLLFLGHCTKRLKYTSRLHVKKAYFLFQGASA